ncbi:hypothetical protein HETIRDRAFT_424659 [Heterobasidion irregulare TC 32-1]|uniref:Retrotransposon gag domain-containing protein n=1 Tax=Heterobasidion irregulare (strain TC 32-1) TaxID=747525 RepID=W4KJ42_HETIT|nr:uncharacterized protein HETIRDRAFT_424659 [Heterobasidion irregulare TC 32-1]ETW85325.1 hypothetical protein HETIRDRAFT_424659 [Heterobasidion irregulare TC 32-1]
MIPLQCGSFQVVEYFYLVINPVETTSQGSGRRVGRVPHGTDYLKHSDTFVHFGQPIRRTSKGNWVYVGGQNSGKTVDAPLVPWEDRKAPLRTVDSPTRTKPALSPVDIPKEDIEKTPIPAGVLTPVDEEDPEPVAGPSQPNPNPNPQPNPPPTTEATDDEDEMSDRGNKPKDFDGTRSKYREWIYECHMYILANPTKYDTDKDKILMVLSYMREGTVSLFAQKYYFDRELREYKVTEVRKTWGTFKDFLKELAAAFKDESLEQKVRQKLFTMRMGKRSADKFVTDYLMTAGESRFDLESTVDYFRRAIHPEILKQIYRLPDMPTTMDDWVKYTRRFDNQWRELQSIKSSVPSAAVRSSNPFRYNSSNAPSSMNNSVVPMAVDSVRTTLTDEERNRLRMEGSARYVQQGSGTVGNRSAQTGSRMGSGGSGYGRTVSAGTSGGTQGGTSAQGRGVATTNPFQARLAARQAHAPGPDAPVRETEPEISREEIQRVIGKMRWDEQEALLQELSEMSKKKESDF